ncbi:AraC family transcriptional regulator [Marinospirillum sp.]|uniref:AraC family transcriptional regulator n=1 Tax=Marinospirillum sp. TaxID=2183934 RepID=UPI00287027F2|nr:AraC family transcriptional regulator [Marinospirillum sp.]MDR9468226.1 AraC family transcriptional regulator [Marinospirillum sp.]
MPNEASATLPMHFVSGLFRGLNASPEHQQKLLQQAGIPRFLLNAPQGRVTVRQFALLYRLLVEEMDDETPGFFSRPLRSGALKFLCLGLLDAPSLQVALYRYCQYFRVLLDDMSYQLDLEGSAAYLSLVENLPPRGDRVLVHELMLKLVHGLASWLIAEKIPPLRIDCAYSRPEHSSEYLYFYPGQVYFDQPQTRIYFDRELLKEPLRQTRRSLVPFLKRAPENWIYVSFADRLLAHRIKEYLLAEHLKATLGQVAEALHLSVRSLSRRLAAEGTCFQAIKDEVRRDQAIAFLTDSNLPLNSLAGHLGFEDLPSFNRAFKKWTGNTPGAYRRGKNSLTLAILV